MEKFIDMPYDSQESELQQWEYTIPEGYVAEITDGKVIIKKEKNEDESIRKWILEKVQGYADYGLPYPKEIQRANKAITYLEKIKEEEGYEAIPVESTLEYRLGFKAGRDFEEQKHYWKPTETDVALFNKVVTTNKALTPAERAQLDIIRSKFGCCRAVNCNGIVQNGEDEECDEESTDFTIYHPIKNGKGKYECIPYSFYGSLTSFSEDKDLIDFLRTCFYTEEECNEWIEQQKSAEWSNEDEKRVKQLVYDTEAIRAGYEKRKEFLGNDFNDELIKDCDEQIKWLKSLPLNLKKKNEDVAKLCSNDWSEEDEKTLISVICGELELSESRKEYFINLLKSLRPNQPKSEWSEEDERMFSRCIKSIETSKQFADSGTLKAAKDKEIAWLKSTHLQPHWKPSVGQLAALDGAIEDTDCSRTYVLRELWNQLKKL